MMELIHRAARGFAPPGAKPRAARLKPGTRMPTPLDRRKFFGTAAALSLPAASYANVAGSNDRLRVAFVGCGGRAQAHIDLVNRFAREGKGVVPAAVCDVWDGLDDEYEV